MFEDGSECSEKVPVKLDGFYFDHGMFYENKNNLMVHLKYNKKRYYDGFYYMADMREQMSTLTGKFDEAEKNIFHLPYADYTPKDSWTFIFSVNDVSEITKSGK